MLISIIHSSATISKMLLKVYREIVALINVTGESKQNFYFGGIFVHVQNLR